MSIKINNSGFNHVFLSSVDALPNINEIYFENQDGHGARVTAGTVGLDDNDNTMTISGIYPVRFVMNTSPYPHPSEMYVDVVAGGVGIGTNVQPLHISGYKALSVDNPGGNGGLIDIRQNGISAGWLYGNAGTLNIDSENSASMIFRTSGVAALSIDGASGLIQTHKPVQFESTAQLQGYTVAALPACANGMLAYVSDALSPVWLAPVAGGGSGTIPVFCSGGTWVAE